MFKNKLLFESNNSTKGEKPLLQLNDHIFTNSSMFPYPLTLYHLYVTTQAFLSNKQTIHIISITRAAVKQLPYPEIMVDHLLRKCYWCFYIDQNPISLHFHGAHL